MTAAHGHAVVVDDALARELRARLGFVGRTWCRHVVSEDKDGVDARRWVAASGSGIVACETQSLRASLTALRPALPARAAYCGSCARRGPPGRGRWACRSHRCSRR